MTSPLNLMLAGEPRRIDYTELDAATSDFTGRPLRRVEAELTVDADLEDRVRQEMAAARHENPLKDTEGGLWSVETHLSRSYGDQDASFSATLREFELIDLERLDFAGVSISPDKAAFRLLDNAGPLVIEALVTVTGEQQTALEQAIERDAAAAERGEPAYFPVLAIGMRDEPISMRFGLCPWEKTENGARYRLVLVSEQGDAGPTRPNWIETAFQPELEALLRTAHQHTAILTALINELQQAGVLSAAAARRIEDAGTAPPTWARRREYLRTMRIEDFWGGD